MLRLRRSPFFAKAAVSFDDVAAEGQVGQGAREVFVFIGDVGFAAERNAVERTRCKLHFAGEFFLRQYAGQVDVAVDAALRKLRIDARRVEGFADDVQLQFAVFEEFERAFGVELAAVLRNQADFVELERALAELFVGLENSMPSVRANPLSRFQLTTGEEVSPLTSMLPFRRPAMF